MLNAIHIPRSCFFYYYQQLHNNCFNSYMFRLPNAAIIRESPFTDMRSVQYFNEW
jgi:hypothetical protein